MNAHTTAEPRLAVLGHQVMPLGGAVAIGS
jgi:hypothetical protein